MRFTSGLLLRTWAGSSGGLIPAMLSTEPAILSKHPAEIGNIDQREDQTDHPEKMLMGEKGYQAQYGYDLELQLLGFMSDAFRQCVQPKKNNTKHEDRRAPESRP